MQVYGIQHKKAKIFKIFVCEDEKVDETAKNIITDVNNPVFKLDPNISSYTMGEMDDFDPSVIQELQNKSGEQYEDLKEDDLCINTNIDKCIEILQQKIPKPKPKPKAEKPKTIDKEITNPIDTKINSKSKIQCECGAMVAASNIEKHKQTKLHVNSMGIKINNNTDNTKVKFF